MRPASLSLVLAGLTLAPALWAQNYELLPVVIESDSSEFRLTLTQHPDEPPFARCRGACSLVLWPGEYWLTVGATAQTVEGTKRFELEEPSRIHVTPIENNRGSALGALGVGLLVGGLVVTTYVATNDEPGDNVFVIPGLASIVAGIVVVLVGGARSGRTAPALEIESLETHEAR